MNELTKKSKLIFKAFSDLSDDQQKKLLKELKDYDSSFYKGSINESLGKSLGPLDTNSCPMCGK